MKICTSYFGNLKNIPKDIVPIAICGKSPNWWQGLEYKVLAPKLDFFNKWKYKTKGYENCYQNNDYYIKCFTEQILDKLKLGKVLARLSEKSNGKDVVLLCYEVPTDFCHRHLVSEWFNNNGIECYEL